jgi:simple sugar transport system substrate-binding protein
VKFRKLVLAALMAAAVALLVSACGSSSNGDSTSGSGGGAASADSSGAGGKHLTFAIITHGNGGSSGFWAVYKHGADDAAKAMNATVNFGEANLDPQKQAQLIEAAVTQRVDGIATTLPNPDALKGALNKAKAAGIPVVVLQSTAKGAEREALGGAIAAVGQDELIAGHAGGEHIKQLGAKHVLCLIHEQSNLALNQRCQGIKEGFGGSVDTLQIATTDDPTTEQAQIKSKLEANDSYDFVVALDTTVATAAAAPAIEAAGSQAKLATFDLSSPAVKGIEDGSIEFSIDQQEYLQPYLAIVLLSLYDRNANLVGGGLPVLTGPSFVDKSNVGIVSKLVDQGTR